MGQKKSALSQTGTRNFILRKLCECMLTLFIVTVISFVLMKISPIDPAVAQAQRLMNATPEYIAQLREEMGLNDPLPMQYIRWLKDAVHLDFGTSIVNGRNVYSEVTQAFLFTLTTVLLAMIIEAIGSVLVACPLYWKRKRLSGRFMEIICFIIFTIPTFFVAS